jgi:hypothetical protein
MQSQQYSTQSRGQSQPVASNASRTGFTGAESQAERELFLRYATSDSVVISGNNDYAILAALKDAISKLQTDFFSRSGSVTIQSEERVDLDRRFLLFEHELDGLLRRRIEYSAKDYEGGTRNLDFTTLLNEKENQIVELEKKIQNLEARLKASAARELELENKIAQLKAESLAAKDRSLTGAKLDLAVQLQADNDRLTKDLESLRANFASAASIWKTQVGQVRAKYPNDRFDLDSEITGLLQRLNVRTYNVNGVETIEVKSERTVEVPVMDIRTKGLIQLFARSLKTLSSRYPRISQELDSRIVEFFSQELIEVIDVDEIDRIVEIVKFVPQTVRVENVYTYASTKSRRVEFHLRVLIKALLEELEKLRLRTGAVLELDEAIIAMINQEIMGVVDVDDILKVFRIVPKIFEVEKIIEKIVERVVEVPQVIPVEKIVERVIEVPRVQEIERVVHVPVEIIKIVDNIVEKIVEVPSIVEKIVEVPKIVEKVVEKIVEVPKIVEVEKIVEKVVINTEVVTVERVVNQIVSEPKEVIVYRDKIVNVEKVVEKIVEVPVYIEKIVEKIIEIEKIKPVEVIREIVVQVARPEPFEKETIIFKDVPQPIEKIIEKVVIVENIIERIVEVPQIVEKIVQVTNEVPKIVEVERIVEKLVPVIQIKEVEKVNNIVVPLIKEVEKIVDRRV